MKKYLIKAFLIIPASLLFSCNCYSSEKKSVLMAKSIEYISKFETTCDSSYLFKAQDLINKIDDNPNTYNVAKLALLCHFKEFEKAAKYFESLNDDIFPYNYQKTMGINAYKALDARHKGDTILMKVYINKNVQLIQNYIDTQGVSDFQTYYELYLFKFQIELSDKTYNEFVYSMKKNGLTDQEINFLYNDIKSFNLMDITNPFYDVGKNATAVKAAEIIDE